MTPNSTLDRIFKLSLAILKAWAQSRLSAAKLFIAILLEDLAHAAWQAAATSFLFASELVDQARICLTASLVFATLAAAPLPIPNVQAIKPLPAPASMINISPDDAYLATEELNLFAGDLSPPILSKDAASATFGSLSLFFFFLSVNLWARALIARKRPHRLTRLAIAFTRREQRQEQASAIHDRAIRRLRRLGKAWASKRRACPPPHPL